MRSNVMRLAILIVLVPAILVACKLPRGVEQRAVGTPEAKGLATAAPALGGQAPAEAVSPEAAPAAGAVTVAGARGGSYALQTGSPAAVVNFAVPEAGCNWMGVGGQVFNLNAEPVSGVMAQLGGNLAGRSLEQIAVTGSAPALGPGGFLIVLGNQPVASQGTLWAQLFNEAGAALSGRIFFNTYAGCDRNLIVMNFAEQIVAQSVNYFPFVGKQRLFYYFPFVGQR